MATLKQKLALQKATENHGNISRAMLEVGYSPNTAKKPQNLTQSKGFKELVKKHFPDSLLAKRHRELLNKKEKIVVGVGKGFSEIEDTGQPHTDVVKALDLAYKLKGLYAEEQVGNKTLIINVSGETAARYGIIPNQITERNSA
jgi:hypothetical protein